jgi:hypothetical protein
MVCIEILDYFVLACILQTFDDQLLTTSGLPGMPKCLKLRHLGLLFARIVNLRFE